VHDYLGITGFGAIIVTAVNGQTPPAGDVNGRLFVASRTWTPQPGTTGGTTSQSLSTVPLSTVNTPAAAFFGIGGADSPNDYRVNVGIVNVDPALTQTFVVTYVPVTGGAASFITVVLPAMTTQQVSVGTFSGQQISVSNVTAAGSNLWTAYASTVN